MCVIFYRIITQIHSAPILFDVHVSPKANGDIFNVLEIYWDFSWSNNLGNSLFCNGINVQFYFCGCGTFSGFAS